MSKPIIIDGSTGEGGGSILRVSAGLAFIKNKTLIINNIRKNRKQPGLRLQHLVGIQTLTELAGGCSNQLQVGSTEVELTPGKSWKDKLDIHIRTAGNIGLLTQTLHNALIDPSTSKREFEFHVYGGGTYGKYAPGTEFLNNVTYQIFKNLGYLVNINVLKHGFYPKGGAEAIIQIKSANSRLDYNPYYKEERGELESIQGIIHIDENLKKSNVAERISSSIKNLVDPHLSRGIEIKIITKYHNCLSVGVGIDMWCNYSNAIILGTGTILGERGISSEKIGKKVALSINSILSSNFTIDEYTSDQIIPFLSLVEENSKFRLNNISSHFETNLNLIQQIIPRKWKIEKQNNDYIFEYIE